MNITQMIRIKKGHLFAIACWSVTVTLCLVMATIMLVDYDTWNHFNIPLFVVIITMLLTGIFVVYDCIEFVKEKL